MKAIIPTGGRGTRLQPLTFSANKHFIPVANKPLIFYPIEAVAEAGIKEVLITYNPGWYEIVKSYLGTGEKWGLRFTYVLQEKPLGLANIFQVCEDQLEGKPFLLHLGDNIFSKGILGLVRHFLDKKSNGLVARIKRSENWRMGVPIFDKKGRLKDYIEKPKDPPNPYAVPGIYFFDKNVFDCFRGRDKIRLSSREEYEIVEPYKWLIKKGFRVDIVEYDGKWLDPGKFDDWIESNRYLLDTKLEGEVDDRAYRSSKLEGRVSVGKGTIIRKSQVRGPVSIGNNVKVINAYIGPYTSIDDGCVIENSHVENSVLMKNVIIRNVKQPVNESLIGTGSEVLDEDGPTDWLKLFVGEKSRLKI